MYSNVPLTFSKNILPQIIGVIDLFDVVDPYPVKKKVSATYYLTKQPVPQMIILYSTHSHRQ